MERPVRGGRNESAGRGILGEDAGEAIRWTESTIKINVEEYIFNHLVVRIDRQGKRRWGNPRRRYSVHHVPDLQGFEVIKATQPLRQIYQLTMVRDKVRWKLHGAL